MSNQRVISLADARRVIDAAEAEAAHVGQPMNVAVVDAGGVPLRRDGEIVGAVGVSGGASTQDQAVAEAGASAL